MSIKSTVDNISAKLAVLTEELHWSWAGHMQRKLVRWSLPSFLSSSWNFMPGVILIMTWQWDRVHSSPRGDMAFWCLVGWWIYGKSRSSKALFFNLSTVWISDLEFHLNCGHRIFLLVPFHLAWDSLSRVTRNQGLSSVRGRCWQRRSVQQVHDMCKRWPRQQVLSRNRHAGGRGALGNLEARRNIVATRVSIGAVQERGREATFYFSFWECLFSFLFVFFRIHVSNFCK